MSLAGLAEEPELNTPTKVVLRAIMSDCCSQMAPEEREAISSILCKFLQQIDCPFHEVPPVPAVFADAAVEYGRQHHSLQKEEADTPRFQRALNCGASISSLMYGHLDIQSQYWVALWTTCATFFDDFMVTNLSSLHEFHPRFMCSEPQRHPVLDVLASLLRRAREHFNPLAANLAVSSTLDFITSHIFDHNQKLKEMKVHESAMSYPCFLRRMTGMGTGYTALVFPPHISFDVYIQALPSMADYIEYVNDILSFYKEQLANEDTNQISLLAHLHGWTKLQALQYLVDLVIEGHRATKEILSAHPEAYEIYTKAVIPGYIRFHIVAGERYKLRDLDLAP